MQMVIKAHVIAAPAAAAPSKGAVKQRAAVAQVPSILLEVEELKELRRVTYDFDDASLVAEAAPVPVFQIVLLVPAHVLANSFAVDLTPSAISKIEQTIFSAVCEP
ncbi:hypothetical protein P029_03660 [Anaplasma phagocytophilum str. Norway variant2]|uniref:Uncharacterized protein n=2 Tax=Anaplasma phagocytophilum TaxID=948 RepID=A0A161IGW1_ANAPH|nr:hypothetical protein P029_03660 [Anaplasma phagocytophilum str. Norway variant2]